MNFKQDGNVFVLRLEEDEEIISSLNNFCLKHGIKSASLLNGIGMLKNFTIGEFVKKGTYEKIVIKKPCELLSLQGNIALDEENKIVIHIHVVVAKTSEKIVGGHLFEGVVNVTNEITLLKLTQQLERRFDQKTGLKQLSLD